MAKLAIVLVVLGACVADGDPTQPPPDLPEVELVADTTDDTAAICAAAAALPATDACSLVCDPDAFAARLADDGMKGGTCYQLRCTLTPALTVTVGICLP